MKYEDLKKEIKSIAEIASSVPEAFRERCFEVLLQHLLSSQEPRKPAPPKQEAEKESKDGATGSGPIPTPSQVKVFLQKTSITTEDLSRVVMYEDDELHFIQEPSTNKIARGQIEWALLLALKGGICANSFAVDPEDVRSLCQEKGFYDGPNFIKNFKTAKNAAFFQGAMESQGEPQKLSADGQKELAKLVKEFAAA